MASSGKPRSIGGAPPAHQTECGEVNRLDGLGQPARLIGLVRLLSLDRCVLNLEPSVLAGTRSTSLVYAHTQDRGRDAARAHGCASGGAGGGRVAARAGRVGHDQPDSRGGGADSSGESRRGSPRVGRHGRGRHRLAGADPAAAGGETRAADRNRGRRETLSASPTQDDFAIGSSAFPLDRVGSVSLTSARARTNEHGVNHVAHVHPASRADCALVGRLCFRVAAELGTDGVEADSAGSAVKNGERASRGGCGVCPDRVLERGREQEEPGCWVPPA